VIGTAVVAAAGDPARDAVAGPADAAELLHVDVDELAGTLLLIAVRRLERLQPPQLAEPDPGQDPRDSRGRHRQRLCDLGADHPQAPQCRDHSDPSLVCSKRHGHRR
jgi:hypothetical protein